MFIVKIKGRARNIDCFAALAMTAIVVFGLFVNFSAYAVSVDATDISNHSYFDAVIKEIDNANSEIYVAMYAAYVRPTETDNPAYKLLQALVNAHNRGVAVQVYLDCSKGNAKGNIAAYDLLSKAKVAVYFIDPKIKLHAKVILIDNKTVIDGSSNWTQKAVEENFESNAILQSEAFANAKGDFFKQLDKVKIAQREQKVQPSVRVSGQLLEDERFFPSMVRYNAEHAFKLYLKLLRSATPSVASQQQGWQNIDYVETAKYLGLKVDKQTGKYRREVRRFVTELKDKYSLLDYRIDKQHKLEVRLVDYNDPARDYMTPQSGFFELPVTFWDYGLDNELQILEKFAYFICLHEGQMNAPKLYWWRGFEVLAQKYHITDKILVKGFGVLEKLDLIEVRRSRVEPGKAFDARKANEYRLTPLQSPQERAQHWQQMERKYSRNKVKAARAVMARWDKENNFYDVEDMIKLIDKYDLDKVQQAMDKVAGYSPNNSARNVVYLEEVVKSLL